MSDEETTRIEKRVDKMDEKIESAIQLMRDIYTDVKIIKNTCETRGLTCSDHFVNIEKKVLRIETDIDGGTKTDGMKVRVSKLESKDSSKEKLLFLVIGALGSGFFALCIFFLQSIFSK